MLKKIKIEKPFINIGANQIEHVQQVKLNALVFSGHRYAIVGKKCVLRVQTSVNFRLYGALSSLF